MPESPPDLDEARALSMGAVAFLRLRRDDLVRAASGDDPARPVGTIVRFPRQPGRPTPASFEDQRWADLHRPE